MRAPSHQLVEPNVVESSVIMSTYVKLALRTSYTFGPRAIRVAVQNGRTISV